MHWVTWIRCRICRHGWIENYSWAIGTTELAIPRESFTPFPAIGTTLIGVLTGHWLMARKTASRLIAPMVLFGILGILAGAFWNRWFPINQNLWTSSFVLLERRISPAVSLLVVLGDRSKAVEEMHHAGFWCLEPTRLQSL